jgi:serine/threonine protein kinase
MSASVSPLSVTKKPERQLAFLTVRFEDAQGNPRTERAHFVDRRIECAPGQSFIRDRYLGSGKNGTVYSCHPEGENQRETLAVKFLHVLTRNRLDRFDFECRVLEGLSHPHVLKLIGAGEVETTFRESEVPFLVTELMEGNLRGRIEHDGPLPSEEIKRLALQICDGFAHVHEQGIIHRDIKPDNFLLRNGDVRIADFGFAKTITDEGDARFYRPDISSFNEVVGPQSFMSPELYRYAKDKSYPVDHRSDLYQIGATIWFLLTGFPPAGLIDRSDLAGTDQDWFEIVERCLRSRPGQRYSDAGELKSAIESLIE